MAESKLSSIGSNVSRFLDTVGDGTGSVDGNVNGSVTPVVLKAVASGGKLIVNRLIIHITDTGAFDASKYGNNITLTNGITVKHMRGVEVVYDATCQIPVKANGDWSAHCYDVTSLSFGVGDDMLTVRWTFTKDGLPIVLNDGDSFEVTINDDLTGLVDHHFKIGAIYVDELYA